ncbi:MULTISPECIES: AAA family ATPase [Bacteria]|uniref:AAA family ATPase n=1 Tax=Escherichia coli TaxID=562 RepID=A0ABD5C7J6_ECOLX|nr:MULTISPECIES: AAA family ATPase [Enterobacteriaceae]MDR5970803.1 AAA family ATPase [Escherichia coli]MDR6023796.1 AAA family ATPase [Escherichia coli]MDR6048086.1 AAA family ATPase [Escherichia coli]MDR6057281.1 AAA family ATPase [Escherichia coli]SQA60484.1 Cell division inhibitor MinD [Raoultella planticola]
MIILFASNKGGVGKTTTAINTAIWLQRNGKKVCIIKADKNDDLFDFVETRRALGADLPVTEQFGDLTQAINQANKKYDYVIVDCAGHDSVEFRTALQVCDVYLCLVKPSSDFETGSLLKVTETVRRVQSINTKLRPFIVMTRVRPQRFDKVIKLRDVLHSDSGWIQPTKNYLSELLIFEDACNSGVGVHEFTAGASLGKAKAQIELLCAETGIL